MSVIVNNAPVSDFEFTKSATRRVRVRENTMKRTLIIVCVFLASSALLVIQRHMINDLDTQIRSLESDYKDVLSLNDSLNGRVIQSYSLKEIEDYAVNKLGMIAPDNAHTEYVTYRELPIREDSASGD